MNSSLSLFHRVSVWFLMAAMGNIVVAVVVFVLWRSPLGISAVDSMNFIHTFASPMFAPALLIFASAPSILLALGRGRQPDEDMDAGRLIARAVQFALTFVLSFAWVMIGSEPTALATVLFALLLGFVTHVLAEWIAPPVMPSAEKRYRDALSDSSRREAWAQASGVCCAPGATKRLWPTLTLFAVAPIAAMAIAGVAYSTLTWGPGWGLAGPTVLMMAACGFGAAALTLAWASMADKADSPSARAWRGGTIIFYGVLASTAFAAVFFSAGPGAAVIGWMILCVTAAQAVALWLPAPWVGHMALRRVATTMTSRHLDRVDSFLAQAKQARDTELAEYRRSLPFWKRLRSRTSTSSAFL